MGLYLTIVAPNKLRIKLNLNAYYGRKDYKNMAGYNVSGSDALKLKFEKHEEDCGGYPFKIPDVYLHGEGVYDYKFPIFDYENDSVILVRNKHILEYRLSWYREMLLKNSNGETEWVAGNMIENEEYETAEFLGEIAPLPESPVVTHLSFLLWF